MSLDNPLHIAFLLLLVLLVFGARRLPELGRSLGSGMRGFRDALTGETPTALAAETNDAMIPSPVCFTSRPPDADNASRTMLSCTPSIAIAASSPSD